LHDIDHLRYQNEKLKRKELRAFRAFNFIILHNKIMGQYLKENGIKPEKQYSINLFDYKTAPVDAARVLDYSIVFAGNLDKSPYIKLLPLLPSSLQFHLYGRIQESEYFDIYDNIYYHGIFSSETIAQEISGSFGMVWDGDSIETCSGALGNYLEYNTPHKISLYISAGLPIIIWSKAAMSTYILENNLGIVIDSLHDLHNKIGALTEQDYNKMQQACMHQASLLEQGNNILTIIDAITK
jgi:hypothetical protein